MVSGTLSLTLFFILYLYYYFFLGSVSLNALAGKIMFRDFVYITYDYSVRVQDGYFIFRWWRSYVPKDVSEGIIPIKIILRK